MIGIIDVGIGNQGSIREAVYSLGHDPMPISEPKEMEELTHLILPGVGAYSHAMTQLHKHGFVGPLRDFAASGRPMLGICLGMQLLASTGDEDGPTHGLGLISGQVTKLPEHPEFRVPHVGWNEVTFSRRHPVFEGVKNGVDFYFVHSYQFIPACDANTLGHTQHGAPVVCAIGTNNVIGLQFHPEKSQKNGLRMLDNFCVWDGAC